ncbi:hypothetical protein SESBI_24719 [Sesbania bispinosa]|nr:hypothetical protein SESBI_24719 [Sesbania bispinosa]
MQGLRSKSSSSSMRMSLMYLRMLLEYLVDSEDSPLELVPEEGEDESSNSNPLVNGF